MIERAEVCFHLMLALDATCSLGNNERSTDELVDPLGRHLPIGHLLGGIRNACRLGKVAIIGRGNHP